MDGEFVGMLGANGAGKTTLMRAALGLVPVASGAIAVLGRAASRGNALVGYMPQNRGAAAGVRLSAWDVVASAAIGAPIRFVRLDKAARREIDWALDQVGARDLARRSIGELSGGERQLVLFSQALIGKPRLMMLDEPLISLDPAHQRSIVEIARRICNDLKIAILFSAHELNPLVNAIDRVLYLGGGAAVIGAVDDVVTGPVLSRLYARTSRSSTLRTAISSWPAESTSSATRTATMSTGMAIRTITTTPMLEYDFMRTAFVASGMAAVLRAPSASSWCCAARPSPAMRSRMSASPARRARCCSAYRRWLALSASPS